MKGVTTLPLSRQRARWRTKRPRGALL